MPQLPPEHYGGRPIPVFGFNSRAGDFLDLLLPDYTHWGNEYSQVTGGTRVLHA